MPDAGRDQLRWIGELQRRSASARGAHELWDAFNAFDVRAYASKVTVPTLVFHVRGDAMVPFEAGRHLAAVIPNARFVPLEGKNHILLASEKAWDVFKKELNEFLAADEKVSDAEVDLSGLTGRENQVLDCIARGLTNEQIAETLKISAKTARNHVSNIFAKLEVAHRSQAIVAARKAGFGRD